MSGWDEYLKSLYVGKHVRVTSSYNRSCQCVGHTGRVLSIENGIFTVLSFTDKKEYKVSINTDDFCLV